MTTESNEFVPYPLSIYKTRTIGGAEFLAIRKQNTAGSSWHVVGQNGCNYGAWESIDSFARAYVAAMSGKRDVLTATPIGIVRLSLQHIQ